MRLFLVLLAILSLAARWADAPCGCAEHNGWNLLAAEFAGSPHGGHDAAEDAVESDCDGGGRMAFAAGARVQAEGSTTLSPAALACVAATIRSPVFAVSPPGVSTPSRAALKVYRV